MENLEWWQIVLLALLAFACMVGIFKAERSWRREFEEGAAAGQRRRVWTPQEREAERKRERERLVRRDKHTMSKRDAQIARIAGNACPPHDPEYDETVNETYCSKCLERLPNE